MRRKWPTTSNVGGKFSFVTRKISIVYSSIKCILGIKLNFVQCKIFEKKRNEMCFIVRSIIMRQMFITLLKKWTTDWRLKTVARRAP